MFSCSTTAGTGGTDRFHFAGRADLYSFAECLFRINLLACHLCFVLTVSNKLWTYSGIKSSRKRTPSDPRELRRDLFKLRRDPHTASERWMLHFLLFHSKRSWRVCSHCRRSNYSHCDAWLSSIELVTWGMRDTGCLEDTEWLCLLIPGLRWLVKGPVIRRNAGF